MYIYAFSHGSALYWVWQHVGFHTADQNTASNFTPDKTVPCLFISTTLTATLSSLSPGPHTHHDIS